MWHIGDENGRVLRAKGFAGVRAIVAAQADK